MKTAKKHLPHLPAKPLQVTEDFIAAITQHSPDKGLQMVRYYGWYSNRAKGERAKEQVENPEAENPAGLQVIDVSDYEPRQQIIQDYILEPFFHGYSDYDEAAAGYWVDFVLKSH